MRNKFIFSGLALGVTLLVAPVFTQIVENSGRSDPYR